MRSTLLSVSLTMALWGSLPAAQADDFGEFSSEPSSAEPVSFDPFESEQVVRAQYGGPAEYATGEDPAFADLADAGADDVVSPAQWFDFPQYGTYFQADALWLARAHNVDRPLVVTLPPGSQTVLSSQDASLTDRYRPGLLLTLGFRFTQVAAVEFTYFGLNVWNNSATVTSAGGNLGLAGTLLTGTNDFIFADRVTYDYGASIQNAEANYKQTIEGLTLLSGFRYFSLTEAVNINSHGNSVTGSGTASDYHVTAFNRLVGWQFGAGQNWQFGRLNAGILGKAGVFANLASQKTLLQDFGNTIIDRNYRTTTTPVSVLGEIQANLSYQVTDWLALRAGYRFIGLNNVALGPDQLDLNAPAFGRIQPVAAHEYLLLHGFNVGGEIRW
jgi:hypothetical protein